MTLDRFTSTYNVIGPLERGVAIGLNEDVDFLNKIGFTNPYSVKGPLERGVAHGLNKDVIFRSSPYI